MYAIFIQTRDGLKWAANAEDEADARAQIDAGDFDAPDVDFIFALPGITAFRDLDGSRTDA